MTMTFSKFEELRAAKLDPFEKELEAIKNKYLLAMGAFIDEYITDDIEEFEKMVEDFYGGAHYTSREEDYLLTAWTILEYRDRLPD